MRLAYVVTDLGLYGTQKWVELAATALAARKHQVTVIATRAPHDRAARLKQAGVRVYAFDAPATLADCRHALVESEAQLVHLNLWERHRDLLPVGRLAGIPLVLSHHGVPRLPAFWERIRKPRDTAAAARWLWLCWRYADAHFGCCETSTRAIRAQLWPWFMQPRIFSVCVAIPLPRLTAPEVIAGPARFLQAASLDWRKNPGATLRAFARVRRQVPSATLTFVGAGPEQAGLEDFIRREAVAGVCFAGPQLDVSRYYGESNICVLPSRAEGLPFQLLEAAGCGLPLIASAVGGNAEIAVDGQTGFLFKSEDEAGLENAMLRLAQDPELRRQMGRRARKLVEERFQLDTQVERLTGFYEKIIAAGAR